MLRTEWLRPTPDEEARGIVAIYAQYNSVFRDKTGKEDVQSCYYTVAMMERRVTRWRKDKSVDLPRWVEPLPIVKPLDTVKVAIVGSRNYPNQQQVIDYVNSLPDNSVIVSGGAKVVMEWTEDNT